jgi:hypothetical protein
MSEKELSAIIRATRGRPSSYSHARADMICARLAEGESLRSICADDTMPAACTVREWILADLHHFATRYARARDKGLDNMADECLVIADSATAEDAQARRLAVDTRKWYLSKLAPKRYGDQQVSQAAAGVQINLVVLPAGADAAAGSLDLRAMIRGGEVRALPAPGGDDDAA